MIIEMLLDQVNEQVRLLALKYRNFYNDQAMNSNKRAVKWHFLLRFDLP